MGQAPQHALRRAADSSAACQVLPLEIHKMDNVEYVREVAKSVCKQDKVRAGSLHA